MISMIYIDLVMWRHVAIGLPALQRARFLPGGRQILPGEFCPAGRS